MHLKNSFLNGLSPPKSFIKKFQPDQKLWLFQNRVLPVYLVPEGFHDITAVSRVYMAKIQKQLGQKRQSNQRRQKSSLGLIWGKPKLGLVT